MTTPCCPPSPVFSIFTGDAKTLGLRLAYTNGLPYDLTTCTEIVINLPNADGSFTQLKLSDDEVVITSPANLGQFTAPISSDDSALLNVAELQNIDVTFTIDSNPFTVRFYGALSVFEAA